MILKKGENAIIEILSESESHSSNLRKKGLISRRRTEDYLPRRKPKTSGLKFYDLGYIQGEPYFDLPFSSLPTLENNFASPVRAVNRDDYEARDSFLFDFTPPEDYAATFSQIIKTQGTIYDLRVSNGVTTFILNSSSDKWNDQNLIVLDASFFSQSVFEIICPNQFFHSFKLKGTGRNKITTVFDFNADDFTTFIPTKTMTIYLLPELIFSVGQAINGTPNYRLNYFYTIFNRAMFFNLMDDFYGYEINGTWTGNPSDSTNYLKAWQATLVQKAKTSARAFNNSFANPNIVNMNLSDYPPAYYTTPPAVPSGGGFLTAVMANATPVPNEALLAIIKQGSQYYYIWKATV